MIVNEEEEEEETTWDSSLQSQSHLSGHLRISAITMLNYELTPTLFLNDKQQDDSLSLSNVEDTCSANALEQLPRDVFEEVLAGFLSDADLLRLSMVNRSFHKKVCGGKFRRRKWAINLKAMFGRLCKIPQQFNLMLPTLRQEIVGIPHDNSRAPNKLLLLQIVSVYLFQTLGHRGQVWADISLEDLRYPLGKELIQQFCPQAIDHENELTLLELARLLEDTNAPAVTTAPPPITKILLRDGSSADIKEVYVRALALNPHNVRSLNQLAMFLGADERVILKSPGGASTEEMVDARELLLRAVHLDPTHGVLLNNLALRYGFHEHFRLKSGEVINRRDLIVRAIDWASAPGASISPHDTAQFLSNLAECLTRTEKIVLKTGETVDSRELLLRAIHLRGSSGEAFCWLAGKLRLQETVTLKDGRKFDKRELCLLAIRLNPTNPQFLLNLSGILHPGEVIPIACPVHPFVELVDSRSLLLKALNFNSRNSMVLHELAFTLEAGQTLKLPNGETLDQKLLYVRAIQASQGREVSSMHELANALAPEEKISLADDGSDVVDRRELLLRAAARVGEVAGSVVEERTWNSLSETLKSPDDTLVLKTGEKVDQIELLRRALDCSPSSEVALFNMAMALAPGQCVILKSGAEIDKKTLLMRASQLAPISRSSHPFYRELASVLAPEEKIEWHNDGKVAKEQIVKIAEAFEKLKKKRPTASIFW